MEVAPSEVEMLLDTGENLASYARPLPNMKPIRRALPLLVMLSGSLAAADCSTPPEGVIGWWSGEANTTDRAGGTSGTVLGAMGYLPGKVGQAFTFNGGSDVIRLPEAAPFERQEFTCELWLRRANSATTSDSPGGGGLFVGGPGSYALVMDHEGRLELNHVAVGRVTGTYRITDLEWHHVALSRSAGSVTFVVDGTQVETLPSTDIFTFGTPFAIGGLAEPLDGQRYAFQGTLDEVTVYDRALSTSQIAAIHAAGVRGKCSAGLQVEIQVVGSVRLRDHLAYRFTVTNSAAHPATEVLLTHPLPSQFTSVSMAVSQGTVTNQDGVLHFRPGPVGPGAVAQLIVGADATQPGTAMIQASMVAGPDDPPLVFGSRSVPVEVIPPCTAAPSGMVSWYRAEGTAIDAVARADGDFPSSRYAAGRVGRGFLFSDGWGSLAVPDGPQFQSEAFSIEGWILPAQANGAVDIIADKELEAAIGQIDFSLGIRGNGFDGGTIPVGNLAFFIGGLTGAPDDYYQWIDGQRAVPTSEWSHVALTYEPGRMAVYLNGALAREVTGFQGDRTRTAGPFRLGGRIDSYHQFRSNADRFDGGLDEFAFYSRALTGAEVAALHAGGAGGRCVRDLELISERGTDLRVALNDLLTLTFRVKNPGDLEATGVVLTNSLPPGMEVVNIAVSRGTYRNLAGLVLSDLGTMEAGAEASVTFQLRPLVAGAFQVPADCSTGEPELSQWNNHLTVRIEAVPQSVSAGPDVAEPEGSVARVEFDLAAPPANALVIPIQWVADSAEDEDVGVLPSGVEFPPGVAHLVVEIPLLQDEVFEGNESFRLRLTPPAGVGTVRGELQVTIVEDDPPPIVRINDASVQEGNTGRTTATFEVTLTKPAESPVTVWVNTMDGTAQGGTDYQTNSVGLEFLPGEQSKTVSVAVFGDSTVEANESFQVLVSSTNLVTLADAVGIGTIINDDVVEGAVASLEWDPISSPQVPGVEFPARLTARDGRGAVVSNFNGAVRLAGVSGVGRPVTLVLADILLSPSMGATLVNASPEPVNAVGWRLSFYDDTRWPAPVTTFTVPENTVIPPGGYVWFVTPGSLPVIAPRFDLRVGLSWRTPSPAMNGLNTIAVVVQDSTGQIQDTFFCGQASPKQVRLPAVISEADWRGGTYKLGRLGERAVVQRIGDRNHRRAGDWAGSGSRGTTRTNGTLRLPMLDGIPLPVVPDVVNLVNGTWSGPVSLTGFASPASLIADDGNGHSGLSAPLMMTVVNDLALTLDSTPILKFRDGAYQHQVTVTNPGPDVASNVVVEIRLDRLHGLWQTAIDRVEVSQGSFETGNYLLPHPGGTIARVVADLGTLPAGSIATVRVAGQGVVEPVSVLPRKVVTWAQVTTRSEDLNVANNEGVTTAELSASCAPISPDLVAWWRAEDGGRDTMGKHPAVPEAGASIAIEPAGRGFQFDGVDDQWTVADDPELNLGAGQDFSFDAWIQVESNERTLVALLDKRGPDGTGYFLYLSDGRLALRLRDATGTAPAPAVSASPMDLRDDRWHYIAVSVRSGVGCAMWVDGAAAPPADPTVAAADLSNRAPLMLGRAALKGSAEPLAGRIDDLCIQRRALSNEDVVALYRAGLHRRCAYRFTVAPISPEFSAPPGGELTAVVPGALGQPYTLTWAITNLGPEMASVSSLAGFSDQAGILSIRSSQGSLTNDPSRVAAVAGDLGPLAAGSAATITLEFSTTNSTETPFLIARGLDVFGLEVGRSVVIPFAVGDMDSDGLPDAWEALYGLDPRSASDAHGDGDGDGLTALQEFEAGTVPNNRASTFALRVVGNELRFNAVAGRLYQVEARGSLSDGGWVLVETFRPTADGSLAFPVSGDPAYYRGIVSRP